MKKGIKKGFCLVHGELNAGNSREYKQGDTKRIRCKFCRRESQAILGINKELRGICAQHGLPKNKENNYTCQKCKNDYAKKKYNENLEVARKKVRDKRSKNIERYRENSILLKFDSLTREQYQEMFLAQKNKCAICKQPETRINRSGDTCKLAVDHCHKTLKIRALLCHACNTGIGKFEDNIALLQKAIEYLKEHES